MKYKQYSKDEKCPECGSPMAVGREMAGREGIHQIMCISKECGRGLIRALGFDEPEPEQKAKPKYDEEYLRANTKIAILGAGCTEDYAQKATDAIIEIVEKMIYEVAGKATHDAIEIAQNKIGKVMDELPEPKRGFVAFGVDVKTKRYEEVRVDTDCRLTCLCPECGKEHYAKYKEEIGKGMVLVSYGDGK